VNNVLGDEPTSAMDALTDAAQAAVETAWPAIDYEAVPVEYVLAQAQGAALLAEWFANLATDETRAAALGRAQFFSGRAAEHSEAARVMLAEGGADAR
jgi:hypothetical protein